MSGNRQPLTTLHHLEFLPGYVTPLHKYKGDVILCPDAARGILKINVSLDTIDEAINADVI